jgi:adrenodoxin-NADP+ reductase
MMRRASARFCAAISGADGNVSSLAAKTSKPRKIQIAVVGSGPSGCYVAEFLTKKNPNIHVDIFEKLPVPFGLVRYGVAPDHPDVKNVQNKFMTMFKSGSVSWIGNISVGTDIPLPVMLDAYSAVVIATGASGSDQSLAIPGETLGHVVSARQFVDYYNTLPDPIGNTKNSPISLPFARDALIIGNGNVAMDVARVLGTTYKPWCPTDMNCFAVKALMESAVERITIAARRGAEHSAFTIAEFRELTTVQPEQLKVKVDPFDLELALQRAEQTRAKKRLLELVHKHCAADTDVATPDKKPEFRGQRRKRGLCTARFKYRLRPLEILPHPERSNYVGSVLFEQLSEADNKPTGTVTIACDVVIKSVGYRPDLNIKEIEVDERGSIPNSRGRVTNHNRLYCSGWAKTGPKGVILHSMTDAQETAATILADIENNDVVASDDKSGKFSLLEYMVLKKLMPVSIQGLERILFVERERGVDLGKAGEKVPSITDMLDLAMGGKLAKRANDRVRGIQGGRPDALLYLGEFLDDDTDMSYLAAKLSKEMPRAIAGESGLHPSQL